MIISPQKGFQMSFLSSPADIVIGGSGAGVGKTFSLLLEGLRNTTNKDFNFVFFRRTRPEITNAGGMRDESQKVYSNIRGATQSISSLQRNFPSGASGRFAGIEHDKDVYNRQGSQICLIGFDELTHFSKKMFFYLMSRNRSTCGVKPYIRATCNPDPYSWVAEFVARWIDEETGFPIPERAGVIRYFLQDQDSYLRGDSVEDLLEKNPHLRERPDFKISDPKDLIKSVTFIPGSIYDNQKLLETNPSYLGSLMSQTEEEKAKLLGGCRKPYSTPDALFQYKAIKSMFSNYIPEKNEHYISCDVALFGSDLAVIGVRKGLSLVKGYIFSTSSGETIRNTIESERKSLYIAKNAVVIDADGVGGGVADEEYTWFHNNGPTIEKENYANLKTQCSYKLAEMVNQNKVSLKDCVRYVDGEQRQSIRKGGKDLDIQECILRELSCIRRDKIDSEGKLKINSKAEQKAIVGRSPDFADMIMMRVYFELGQKYLGFI